MLNVFEGGDHVIIVYSVCPFNTSLARGSGQEGETYYQRRDFANDMDSVTHKKGLAMRAQQALIHGLREMTKKAASKKESAAKHVQCVRVCMTFGHV